MLIASSRRRESVTATVTLPPTLESTLMSTPSPSAAIDTIVSTAASLVIGATTRSGMIWKDRSVRMYLHFEYPRGNYWFSSARWQAKSVWLVLQGPGRVAVQSVFERPEGTGSITNSSGATTQYW